MRKMALELVNYDKLKHNEAMKKLDIKDYYEFALYKQVDSYYEHLAIEKNKNKNG